MVQADLRVCRLEPKMARHGLGVVAGIVTDGLGMVANVVATATCCSPYSPASIRVCRQQFPGECDVSECPADHRRRCCRQYFPGGDGAPEWPAVHHGWCHLNSCLENATVPSAPRTIVAGVTFSIFLEEMVLPSGLQTITNVLPQRFRGECDVSECPADHRRRCCRQYFPGGDDASEWLAVHHGWC